MNLKTVRALLKRMGRGLPPAPEPSVPPEEMRRRLDEAVRRVLLADYRGEPLSEGRRGALAILLRNVPNIREKFRREIDAAEARGEVTPD